MNDSDATETAKIVLAEIAGTRDWTQIKNPNDLFLSCETIIANLAFMVGPLMAAEQDYRRKVRAYIEAGKSNAAADALAKSDDEYIYWKKLLYAYELGQDQVMLLKRFKDTLQEEYMRS